MEPEWGLMTAKVVNMFTVLANDFTQPVVTPTWSSNT
jgi:hypothetical protein